MKQPALTQNQVAAAVERAVARADGKAEVKKIAALDEFDYEREREKTAEALGVRVGVLDKMVKRARAIPPCRTGVSMRALFRSMVPPCSMPCGRCFAATSSCRRVPTPHLRSGSCIRGR
jgi:hypothetical protein